MDTLGPAATEELAEITMNPGPEEIRSRIGAFPSLGRGYDPDAVDVFLRRVADVLDDVSGQNTTLRARLNDLSKQITFHESRAWAVQDALVTAQTLRAQVFEKAEKEAEETRRQASREAEALLGDVREERARLEAEIASVKEEAARLKEEAVVHAKRITDHARAEVEVMRQDAINEDTVRRAKTVGELEALRKKVETELEAQREQARIAVKQIEEEGLQELERRSADLVSRIQDQHQALERLESKRLALLDRLEGTLQRQIRFIERERGRAPGQEQGAAEALPVGPSPSGSEGVPDPEGVEGIVMPDQSVVIVGGGKAAPGPKPLTDAPGPLDPGYQADEDDDDMPIAAKDQGSGGGRILVDPVRSDENDAPEASGA